MKQTLILTALAFVVGAKVASAVDERRALVGSPDENPMRYACGEGQPSRYAKATRKHVKFLFVTDAHVESDFVEGHGLTKGDPASAMWRPGNHAALVETYHFINEDPFCRDIDFALFGGDQVNTGYAANARDMADEKANYYKTLEALDVHARHKGEVADFHFVAEPWTVRENLGPGMTPYSVDPKPPVSRVIAIQGNHDTGVDEFYRDCAFTAGNVRFIAFFASYVGLPPTPEERFNSTGSISDETVAFVEREMMRASSDRSIRHIVLVSHWSIAPRTKDFGYGILSEFPGVRLNRNRDRILAPAERYGCRLYLNGHEHDSRYPVAAAGVMKDINCGSLASEDGEGAFAVVEIDDEQARFFVYSRAVAEEPDGRVVITARPRRLFVRKISLR